MYNEVLQLNKDGKFVEYINAVEVARDKGYKSGAELCRKYSDFVIQKYNKNWLPKSLFYEIKFDLNIRAFSFNQMYRYRTGGNPTTTEEYRIFKSKILSRLRRKMILEPNLFKNTGKINWGYPVQLKIEAYVSTKEYEGKLYPMDTSNIIKPIEDAVYTSISEICGVKNFDDKINTKVITEINDIKDSRKDKVIITLSNDFENLSEYSRIIRCSDLEKEINLLK